MSAQNQIPECFLGNQIPAKKRVLGSENQYYISSYLDENCQDANMNKLVC